MGQSGMGGWDNPIFHSVWFEDRCHKFIQREEYSYEIRERDELTTKKWPDKLIPLGLDGVSLLSTCLARWTPWLYGAENRWKRMSPSALTTIGLLGEPHLLRHGRASCSSRDLQRRSQATRAGELRLRRRAHAICDVAARLVPHPRMATQHKQGLGRAMPCWHRGWRLTPPCKRDATGLRAQPARELEGRRRPQELSCEFDGTLRGATFGLAGAQRNPCHVGCGGELSLAPRLFDKMTAASTQPSKNVIHLSSLQSNRKQGSPIPSLKTRMIPSHLTLSQNQTSKQQNCLLFSINTYKHFTILY